ncbi:uncharacterized protein Tco025E_01642 [Trypanosoma conorhini]|uniref:Uncharacterized protein n=1 Tax=Trypanosoma conorhini TaxID=83891 RepID=A0A422Q813_9TRYP|nr:uncharacterized protein Tco025E_01642 [Trypanosoma conorhini]RNF26113.1 hypothetical protein Tco025E_01642 [Trypanosoma conorhini]
MSLVPLRVSGVMSEGNIFSHRSASIYSAGARSTPPLQSLGDVSHASLRSSRWSSISLPASSAFSSCKKESESPPQTPRNSGGGRPPAFSTRREGEADAPATFRGNYAKISPNSVFPPPLERLASPEEAAIRFKPARPLIFSAGGGPSAPIFPRQFCCSPAEGEANRRGTPRFSAEDAPAAGISRPPRKGNSPALPPPAFSLPLAMSDVKRETSEGSSSLATTQMSEEQKVSERSSGSGSSDVTALEDPLSGGEREDTTALAAQPRARTRLVSFSKMAVLSESVSSIVPADVEVDPKPLHELSNSPLLSVERAELDCTAGDVHGEARRRPELKEKSPVLVTVPHDRNLTPFDVVISPVLGPEGRPAATDEAIALPASAVPRSLEVNIVTESSAAGERQGTDSSQRESVGNHVSNDSFNIESCGHNDVCSSLLLHLLPVIERPQRDNLARRHRVCRRMP